MPAPRDYAQHDHPAFAERLLRERFVPAGDLAIEAWTSDEPVPFAARTSGKHLQLKVGERWGDLFGCAWFRFSGTVPTAPAGPVVLLIDVNGELLVVDAAGIPVRGLTNQSSVFERSLGKPGKTVLPLADLHQDGPQITVWADGGANDLFGFLQGEGRIAEARIAVLRPELQALGYDVEVLADLARALPEGDGRRLRIGAALDACVRRHDGSDDGIAACRALLAPLLAERGGDRTLNLSAVGHSHLDLAWLWPLRESRRKAARTLATVMRNLERYPDYVYGISQPQQLAWIQEEHPALFAQIQEAVAAGRIECQGGMWVESDTNLVSAESLARQLLYGQRAWQAWFGRTVRTCWLPDVFGYSAALPQILSQAGIDRFMTIKLSWSKVNRFPHHTFRWRSPDGSEVLAHMPPEGTYNSAALPRSAVQAAQRFQDAARTDRGLLVFGIGDGGGGPGEEHLERLQRTKDLAGMPTVLQESSERCFERIAAQQDRLAAWSGELYLECHQGTLTSQGRMKMANRRLEWALRRAELAASRAWLAGAAWPAQRLGAIWRDVLLHQFHDILPGSSIGRVYAEAEARSQEMLAQLEAITAMADAQALPAGQVVVNDLSWPRQGWLRSAQGWHQAEVPTCGAVQLGAPGATPGDLDATPQTLCNGLLRATFAADGRLLSLLDLEHGREALSAPGNDLIAFEDPGDAWDFPPDYLERRTWRPEQTAVRAGVDGPEAWIERTLSLGTSTIIQRIVLAAGSRRLEFRTRVDWQERGRMLRVRFPIAVHAEAARCEIAIGSIARPTHANTSWDAARFEVPAHAWVDLSERGYGVALLNDGKYGHRLDGDVLDLALLRSPSYPDPNGDKGAHEFTYALYPHLGDHAEGRVTQEAHDLNAPLRLATGGSGTLLQSLVAVDEPGVIISAVKRAEDGDLLIVRLMEVHGATSTIRLRCAARIGSAHLGNLLEEADEALPVADGVVTLRLPPWSLRTVLLRVQR